MKQSIVISISTFLVVFFASCEGKTTSNLTKFSEQIPADIPIVFGQGVISTDDAMEFAITFNPEMDELFFTRRKPEERNNIFTSKFLNDQWTEPELAFFSSEDTWDFEPHINPKGDILYFGTNKPLNDSISPTGLHEWQINKNDEGWSEPIPLQEPFVDDRFVMYVSASTNGNLYFNSEEIGAKPGDELYIYSSFNDNGSYSEYIKLGREINSGTMIGHPFIAPDESYLIFDGQRDSGYGDCDLYISFKENGSWSKSYNLGAKINTEMCEMTASVSPDGNYLFFHRNNGEEDGGNIFWVDFIQLKKELLEENIKKNTTS